MQLNQKGGGRNMAKSRTGANTSAVKTRVCSCLSRKGIENQDDGCTTACRVIVIAIVIAQGALTRMQSQLRSGFERDQLYPPKSSHCGHNFPNTRRCRQICGLPWCNAQFMHSAPRRPGCRCGQNGAPVADKPILPDQGFFHQNPATIYR